MPIAANAVACQPIVARTWRRSKPEGLEQRELAPTTTHARDQAVADREHGERGEQEQ